VCSLTILPYCFSFPFPPSLIFPRSPPLRSSYGSLRHSPPERQHSLVFFAFLRLLVPSFSIPFFFLPPPFSGFSYSSLFSFLSSPIPDRPKWILVRYPLLSSCAESAFFLSLMRPTVLDALTLANCSYFFFSTHLRIIGTTPLPLSSLASLSPPVIQPLPPPPPDLKYFFFFMLHYVTVTRLYRDPTFFFSVCPPTLVAFFLSLFPHLSFFFFLDIYTPFHIRTINL